MSLNRGQDDWAHRAVNKPKNTKQAANDTMRNGEAAIKQTISGRLYRLSVKSCDVWGNDRLSGHTERYGQQQKNRIQMEIRYKTELLIELNNNYVNHDLFKEEIIIN